MASRGLRRLMAGVIGALVLMPALATSLFLVWIMVPRSMRPGRPHPASPPTTAAISFARP